MKRGLFLLTLITTSTFAGPSKLELGLSQKPPSYPLGARDTYATTWEHSRNLLESEKLSAPYQTALQHVFQKRFVQPRSLEKLMDQNPGTHSEFASWLRLSLEDIRDFYRLVQAARLEETRQFNTISRRMQDRQEAMSSILKVLQDSSAAFKRETASAAKL